MSAPVNLQGITQTIVFSYVAVCFSQHMEAASDEMTLLDQNNTAPYQQGFECMAPESSPFGS